MLSEALDTMPSPSGKPSAEPPESASFGLRAIPLSLFLLRLLWQTRSQRAPTTRVTKPALGRIFAEQGRQDLSQNPFGERPVPMTVDFGLS